MGNEVYTKVETDSELLMSTIPHSPLWRHFTRDSIPQPFINIAVSGPILDNLLILSRGGSYLALAASHGTEPWGDEMLVHYTFTLSEEGQKSIGGTLGTLLGRVGESGYVDVWIDEASAEPRYMVFQGENYSSTTTISAINIPKAIEPPVL